VETRTTIVSVAVLLASSQATMIAFGQEEKDHQGAAVLAAPQKTPISAKSPKEWIQYQATTFTPVIDDVTEHLAAARAALTRKDNAKAAEAMQAAARALATLGNRAAKLERESPAPDPKVARDVPQRMAALSKKLDVTAVRIKAGNVPTIAALDKELGKAARSDLDLRWLVSDVTSWYPVVEEPQRHFGAATKAFRKKDYPAATTEVRKAAGYLRLESARATGDAQQRLDAAHADLEETAQSLEKGAITAEEDLEKVFANANHALALAHRSKAAESWARKDYYVTGHELKAAAHNLQSAASWTRGEGEGAALATAADSRAVGNKLASGGAWTKNEVAQSLASLGTALNRLDGL
jgi:hypothetical protein